MQEPAAAGFLSRMEQISNKDLHSEQRSHTFSQPAALGRSTKTVWVHPCTGEPKPSSCRDSAS